MKRRTISILAVFSFAASAAFAQAPTPATQTAVTGKTIQQRKANQQNRVGEGLENGSLTAREAAKVEKKEKSLNAEERDMREDNGGKLTTADKAKLTRQQNQLSKNIYKQKHDAQVQSKAGNEANQRDRNQQKRIGEGLEKGSLTAGEAKKLEKRESKLNAEERDMREDNGGRLTASEKAKVNRQQNRVSKQIYNKKHNARKRG